MLNKKDPLIDAIKQVMQNNQADRDTVKAVNEKFGIQDRRVLPHERQGEWDAAYKSILTEGVEALDEKVNMTKKQFANLDGKPGFTGADLAHARAKTHEKKAATGTLEEDQIDEKAPPGREDQVKTLKKKVGKESAFKIAWSSYKKKKKIDEGFNNRHDSSVIASADKQVVADQLNEKVGVPLAARQQQQQVAKDNTATNARLAREPAVAPSSIGTKVGNAVGAVDAGVRKFAQGLGGDYVAAAGDYAVKNIGAKLGIGQGTTYAKELGQEKEKSARAELNRPTATAIGKAADDISTVTGVAGLAKSGIKYGAKKLIQKGADDAVAATTKTLPAPTKAVSQAAREPASVAATKTPTAVDKFITKAKATPVSPAAKEGSGAASKAAANVSKYSKPSTAGGRFTDNLAKARKGSENYGPSKGGVAVRKTTEPAVVKRPGVPAVVKKPGVPAVVKRPGVPAVAKRPSVPAVSNRPGLPSTVGSAASTATRSSRFGGLGKALKYGAVGAAVGGAAYGLRNKGQPSPAQAKPAKDQSRVLAQPSGATAQPYGMKTPQKPAAPAPAAPVAAKPAAPAPAAPVAAKPAAPAPAAPVAAKPAAPVAAKPVAAKPAAPVAAKPVAAKPVAAKPVAAKPVAASAVRSKPQTRYQRDNTIGADGRPTKGPGGVKSGTTIRQKVASRMKRPVGTGREK